MPSYYFNDGITARFVNTCEKGCATCMMQMKPRLQKVKERVEVTHVLCTPGLSPKAVWYRTSLATPTADPLFIIKMTNVTEHITHIHDRSMPSSSWQVQNRLYVMFGFMCDFLSLWYILSCCFFFIFTYCFFMFYFFSLEEERAGAGNMRLGG